MTPLCGCHGEPMYRNNSHGGWRCRVKVRDRQRRPDLAYWHAPDGGYVRRRRRTLAGQRAAILARLDTLREEAKTAC